MNLRDYYNGPFTASLEDRSHESLRVGQLAITDGRGAVREAVDGWNLSPVELKCWTVQMMFMASQLIMTRKEAALEWMEKQDDYSEIFVVQFAHMLLHVMVGEAEGYLDCMDDLDESPDAWMTALCDAFMFSAKTFQRNNELWAYDWEEEDGEEDV